MGLAGAGRGMAWLEHGWDRPGLAGGKDLGGASVGLGGYEWVRAWTLRYFLLNPFFLLLPF